MSSGIADLPWLLESTDQMVPVDFRDESENRKMG